MKSCDSLGEPCRYCGSEQIILWPLRYAGKCACCSWESREGRPRLERIITASRRADKERPFFVLPFMSAPTSDPPSGKRFGRRRTGGGLTRSKISELRA